MKLISYSTQGRESYGCILAGDAMQPDASMSIIDLGSRLPYADLRALLSADGMNEARAACEGQSGDFTYADVTLRRPIPYPEKVVCVGVNYADRNAEYKDNSKEASRPSLFIRFPDSLGAHGDNLIRPPESEQLDYEGEIVIIIGKEGRRIPAEKAHEHIAGLTIMNEGTIRDWLRHSKFNVTQGKNFVATGAIGPWMVTRDECPDFTHMHLNTTVNDETRQDDNTERMMYPFSYLLNYISTFMLLKAGDVIATGTPTGAGARFDPPKWLVPGDQVTITVDGIGTLSNTVADE